jgi:hypothetical protein
MPKLWINDRLTMAFSVWRLPIFLMDRLILMITFSKASARVRALKQWFVFVSCT